MDADLSWLKLHDLLLPKAAVCPCTASYSFCLAGLTVKRGRRTQVEEEEDEKKVKESG